MVTFPFSAYSSVLPSVRQSLCPSTETLPCGRISSLLAHNSQVGIRNRIKQSVEYGLTEAAAVPGPARAAKHDMGDAILLGEGCDCAHDIIAFERHGKASE